MRKRASALVYFAAIGLALAAVAVVADTGNPASSPELSILRDSLIAGVGALVLAMANAIKSRINPNPVEQILRNLNDVLTEEKRCLEVRLASALAGDTPLVEILREELAKEEKARKEAERLYRASQRARMLEQSRVDERELVSSTDPIDRELLEEIRTGSFAPVVVDLEDDSKG